MSGSANTHAKLSPSGSSQWMRCTASIRHIELNQHRIPEDNDSVYSLEGTQAHDYAEEILLGEIDIQDIPEEFQEPVGVYVDECRRLIEEHPELEPFIEEKVPLFYSQEDTGTVDFAVVSEKYIALRDLKYGMGEYVNVEGNTQQAIYALSLAEDLEDLFDFEPDTVVDIGIVQPRHRKGNPVRTWVITLADLRDFCKTISEKVDEIHTGEVSFGPSEVACRWCDARLFCKARNAELIKGMPKDPTGIDFLADIPPLDGRGEALAHAKKDIEERLIDTFARDMTDEDIVAIWTNRKGIETMLKDCGDYLFKKAKAGEPVVGTKLVLSREGNPKWSDEAAADKFLANQKIPVADRRVTKTITLAQARKLIADRINPKHKDYAPRTATRFKELTYRSPSNQVLALESDKRDAISNVLEDIPDLAEPEDIK